MKVWTVVLQTMPYQCSVQPACSQDQQSITIEAWWYLSATNIAAILRRMQPRSQRYRGGLPRVWARGLC